MLGLEVTVQPAHHTVKNVGRMKYLSPIYKALLTTTEPVKLDDKTTANGIDVAKDWY